MKIISYKCCPWLHRKWSLRRVQLWHILSNISVRVSQINSSILAFSATIVAWPIEKILTFVNIYFVAFKIHSI